MGYKHSTEFISTSSRDLQLVDLVNDVFRQAVSRNYSDLHFESQDDGGMLIRAREDGALVDLQTIDQTAAAASSFDQNTQDHPSGQVNPN